jgi:hypothetical protein
VNSTKLQMTIIPITAVHLKTTAIVFLHFAPDGMVVWISEPAMANTVYHAIARIAPQRNLFTINLQNYLE